jgi:hypothetical protein
MNAPWPMGLPLDVLAEEVPHQVGDRVAIFLKREVSGVEQVKLQSLQVFLVWLSAGSGEDRIVLAPNDECRWLVRAEVGLPRRVQRRVAAVAMEQRELDLGVPRPVEQWLVDVPVSGLIASLSQTPWVYCQMVASRVRKPRRGFSRSAVFSVQYALIGLQKSLSILAAVGFLDEGLVCGVMFQSPSVIP